MSSTNASANRWTTECDVAMIIALREELQAADIFDTDEAKPIPNDLDLEIHARSLSDAKGQGLRLLTVLLDDQGPESAAIATAKLLQRVELKLLVLVGISGRISSDARLGDVVLATTCDNSLYRAKRKAQATLPGGKEWPLDALSARLATAVAAVPPFYTYAGLEPSSQAALAASNLIRNSPQTLHGPICTTPFLVDDPDFHTWLQSSRNRNILATDMESAAVVQAAHACGVRNGRVLVVRGISDLADGSKAQADTIGKGVIRRIAMRNAAALASHCISRLLDFSVDGLRVRGANLLQEDEALSPYSEPIALLRLLAEEVDTKRKTEGEACAALASREKRNSQLSTQLMELAEASYRQAIERKEGRHQNVLQQLPRTALDFLSAKWIMDSLASEDTLARAVEVLSKVYPQRINRFCKAFLTARHDEGHLVDGLMRAYSSKARGQAASKSQERAKAHICYLLGRLRNPQQRARATSALINWRQKLVPHHMEAKLEAAEPIQLARIFHSIESPERRLLLRTMCISLILLDQPVEAEKYVRACLRSKEFDSLNRGFHLEYYGDIDYDPSQSMNSVDPVTGQWTHTFETLLGKLEQSYSTSRPYALRDVELQTLLSLAQHRHSANVLERDQRLRLVEFLNRWSPERLSSIRLLQAFCEILRDLLSRERLRRADLIRKLCELKKLPRSGWNDCNARHTRSTPNPESVLAHTAGGLLLIHFWLPDRLSKEDRQQLGDEAARAYSKDEVSKIFLSHDLAEAYTGDLLPHERTDETKAEEMRVNSQIDLFSTWPGFHHFGMYRAWSEFENASTINGRVAKEIDALENLLQLTIEQSEPDVQISDLDAWKDDIARKISTPMGRRILEMLLE